MAYEFADVEAAITETSERIWQKVFGRRADMLIVHFIIGGDQLRFEGAATLEQLAPYLSEWFDALALTKRIDNLTQPATGAGPAGGTALRLTLEDTPPSR